MMHLRIIIIFDFLLVCLAQADLFGALSDLQNTYNCVIATPQNAVSTEKSSISNFVHQVEVDAVIIEHSTISIQHNIYGDVSFTVNEEKSYVQNNRIRPIPINKSNNAISIDKMNSGNTATKRLVLADENLSVIPYHVFSLKNLEYLDLSNNRLISLPEEIKNLTKLKEIRLGRNKFDKFPTVLSYLPELEIIDLSGNKIKTINEDLSK
ncbi:hypothetical protein SDC9_148879 [bioreactor metagenome]|uniref:Leucine-rich repeat domain-containing protein n=1 Tax=bioreactor metagenome TaxID=1076179 RepID=A0A645EI37_9ZZZZ